MEKEIHEKMEVKIGMPAPDFGGYIAEGVHVSNSQFVGKYVVLYFYPKDNTPGCTIEANGFNALKDDFDRNNTVVLGVSKDDLASHDRFREKYSLAFDLISDEECVICENYGVWQEKSMFGRKYMGIQRATFLIDPSGNIAYIWPKVSIKGHAQEVLDKIKEVQ